MDASIRGASDKSSTIGARRVVPYSHRGRHLFGAVLVGFLLLGGLLAASNGHGGAGHGGQIRPIVDHYRNGLTDGVPGDGSRP